MKFLILLIVASCSTATVKPLETTFAEPVTITHSPTVMDFKVSISDTNYSNDQKLKLYQAVTYLEDIFNSKEYKQEILNRKLTSENGKTNLEVFEHIMRGKETLSKDANQALDLTVSMYYKKFSKVIGYTTPSSLIVNTNSKFHNSYGPCDIASNLAHEWTHKMGYGHVSASDWTSVPYTHSTIIRILCPLSEQGKLNRR